MTPRERALKTVPKNDVGSCVHFCLRSIGLFGKMWFKLDAIGNFTEAGLPTDDIFGLQQELRLPDFVDDGVEVESLTGTTT